MRLAIEIGSLRLYTPLARARFCCVFLSKSPTQNFARLAQLDRRRAVGSCHTFKIFPVKAKPQVCE
jgi:hypothetical protein